MIDLNRIKKLVQAYIDANFQQPSDSTKENERTHISYEFRQYPRQYGREPDEIDFKTSGETFSNMLLRLIEESGKKRAVIYARANIDRRHFSKIANDDDYKPSKQTVLAFAIALKLDFEQTKDLLTSAGFSLTNSNLSDVIVSFFIEHKIFDINAVNQILYKYDQPLLGS